MTTCWAAGVERRQVRKRKVKAALAVVPGSNLHFYLNCHARAGSRAQGVYYRQGVGDEFRVYVHPGDTSALKVVNEDERPMKAGLPSTRRTPWQETADPSW